MQGQLLILLLSSAFVLIVTFALKVVIAWSMTNAFGRLVKESSKQSLKEESDVEKIAALYIEGSDKRSKLYQVDVHDSLENQQPYPDPQGRLTPVPPKGTINRAEIALRSAPCI